MMEVSVDSRIIDFYCCFSDDPGQLPTAEPIPGVCVGDARDDPETERAPGERGDGDGGMEQRRGISARDV